VVLTGAAGVVAYSRLDRALLPLDRNVAVASAGCLALVGAGLGVALGLHACCPRRAVLLAVCLGAGGGMAGMIVGGLLGALVHPVVRAPGGH
jgi:hypothetical protein